MDIFLMNKKLEECNEVSKKSNESGLKHWWKQKLSAVAMFPLTIWFLINLPSFLSLSYTSKVAWLEKTTNFVFLILFLLISSYHMKLGLIVVIEDYIHNNFIKRLLIKALQIFTLASSVLLLVVVLKFLRII